MTTTIVYADASDGHLISSSSSYATARSGGSFASNAGAASMIYGQSWNGSSYGVAVGYVRWTYTAPANEVVTAASIRLQHLTATGASVPRDLEIRSRDWGTTLETTDWQTTANWGIYPLLGVASGTQTAPGKSVLAGSAALVDLLNASGTTFVRAMLTSRNARIGQTPTADEVCTVSSADEAGTANDPALIYTTAPVSSLFGTLAAQVRMADDSWCVLESDGAYPVPAVTLKRHTGTAATTIAALSLGTGASSFAYPSGAQSFALATDSADRVYVVGRVGNNVNGLAVQAFTRNPDTTWSVGNFRSVSMPSYGGTINAVAAAMTTTNGVYSDLYVLAAHGPDVAVTGTGGNDVVYARLSGQAIVTGSGTVSIETGSAIGKLLPERSKSGVWSSYASEVGSGLDLVTVGRIGYAVSFAKGAAPGDLDSVYVGRFNLDTGSYSVQLSGISATKDGGAKLRVIPTGGSTVCVASADRTTGNGISVRPYQVTDAGWTALAPAILLDSESVPSMPAASTLSAASTWDAAYYPPGNRLWVYYCPSDRTVRRTSVDLSTYQAVRDSVTVSTVGASGGTNLALRLARNASVGMSALPTVAHRASGGILTTAYILDSYNLAPSAPTLATRGNFDATTAVPLSWSFADPDPTDTQSAYELEIVNVGTGTTVVTTGKVTSTTPQRTLAANTLTNGVSYQWRVRTYDFADAVSPWSAYGSFSTAAGGTVTITNPATDNPAGVITDDFTISWSVAGTTQASYRVQVVRVSSGVDLVDTGYVTSTATSYTITGMLSDIQYEARVTVRNASAVTSNTETRKITPSYAGPEIPELDLTDRGDAGYMLADVSNPLPGAPAGGWPVYGFETDVAVLTSASITATQDSTAAYKGTYSAKLVTTTTPALIRTRSADAPYVTAGRRYTASYWAMHPTGASNLLCAINWRPTDPAGTTISTSSGSGFTLPAGVWTQVTVTAQAPPGAERCVYGPGFTSSPAAGFTYYVDELTFSLASDRPAATANDIYRRLPGGAWVKIGTTGPDGDYRDYTAASGVTYEYKARALAAGTYTDSATDSGNLSLEGAWLHDPLDATGTARQLRYGAASRSGDLEVVSGLTHFAGRALPVADFGENETEEVRVSAVVPFGPTWSATLAAVRALARLRRPLVLRDNRGRALRGIMTGHRESDENYGTQISFMINGTDGGL